MNLQKYIDEKYISVQTHPTQDLYIYNYTQKAQFEKVWTEETMSCRGLIMTGSGHVVARPFKKFFNYGEYEGEIPNTDFEVTEKMDGSLGILYWIGDVPYIATRGSFTSDQAIEGTKMLEDLDTSVLDRRYTYLFEIIYPENRIVVDYKGKRGLVLLAVIDTVTGAEVSKESYRDRLDVVKTYKGITDISKLKEMEEENKEGFVITYANGLRLKVKFDEYVRLHRLVTGINARHIWENMMEGKGTAELIDRVPDEFYQWVKDTSEKIQKDYDEWEKVSKLVYNRVKDMPTRKEQAEFIQAFTCRSIIFSMLDGKDYSKIIWKMIKPEHQLPFKKEL